MAADTTTKKTARMIQDDLPRSAWCATVCNANVKKSCAERIWSSPLYPLVRIIPSQRITIDSPPPMQYIPTFLTFQTNLV